MLILGSLVRLNLNESRALDKMKCLEIWVRRYYSQEGEEVIRVERKYLIVKSGSLGVSTLKDFGTFLVENDERDARWMQ